MDDCEADLAHIPFKKQVSEHDVEEGIVGLRTGKWEYIHLMMVNSPGPLSPLPCPVTARSSALAIDTICPGRRLSALLKEPHLRYVGDRDPGGLEL